MNEILVVILKRMCSIVGADYSEINFQSNDWFLKYSWNKEQESEFQYWLQDKMFNDAEWRKLLMRIPRRTKKYIKIAVEQFCFNYGWKYNDK